MNRQLKRFDLPEFQIGDRVICISTRVIGYIEKIYYPTASEKQIMVRTDDGRLYHAPARMWFHTF